MSQGVYVLGGKCPGGKCPGGKCPGGKCPGGKCPWGKCPGGTCPGGLCPRTIGHSPLRFGGYTANNISKQLISHRFFSMWHVLMNVQQTIRTSLKKCK